MDTLNELIKQFHDVEQEIIDNGGIINDELMEMLEDSKDELGDKLNRIEEFRRYLLSQIDFLKGQEARYYARRKSFENSVKWLKKSQANALLEMGESKLKTAEYTFSVKTSESIKFDPLLATLKEKKAFIDIGLGDAIFKPNLKKMKDWYKGKSEEDYPSCLRLERKQSVTVR